MKTRPAWTGVEYCGTDCRKGGKLVKQIRKMKNLNKEFDPKLDPQYALNVSPNQPFLNPGLELKPKSDFYSRS